MVLCAAAAIALAAPAPGATPAPESVAIVVLGPDLKAADALQKELARKLTELGMEPQDPAALASALYVTDPPPPPVDFTAVLEQLKRAESAYDEGDLQRARTEIDQVLQKLGTDAPAEHRVRARLWRSTFYGDSGDPAKAAEEIERMFQIDVHADRFASEDVFPPPTVALVKRLKPKPVTLIFTVPATLTPQQVAEIQLVVDGRPVERGANGYAIEVAPKGQHQATFRAPGFRTVKFPPIGSATDQAIPVPLVPALSKEVETPLTDALGVPPKDPSNSPQINALITRAGVSRLLVAKLGAPVKGLAYVETRSFPVTGGNAADFATRAMEHLRPRRVRTGGGLAMHTEGGFLYSIWNRHLGGDSPYILYGVGPRVGVGLSFVGAVAEIEA